MLAAVTDGEKVADHLTPGSQPEISPENVQPNGVDLRVGDIYKVRGKADFCGDDYEKPERKSVSCNDPPGNETPYFRLHPGHHIIVYDEEIAIPKGYVGHVYPRSRLMRCGLHMTTALWDQGYEGRGEGMLIVPPAIGNVKIPVRMPIAQMVFRTAELVEDDYDGTHQGERLSNEEEDGLQFEGVIDFYNNTGGYGFIVSDEVDDDVFFSEEDVGLVGHEPEGKTVEFEVRWENKGPKATVVKKR